MPSSTAIFRVDPPATDPGVEFVWVTDPDELASLGHPRPEQVSERLSAEASCAALIDEDGRCLAQRWISEGFAYGEVDVKIVLPAPGVWFFDAWTAPDQRNRGHARALARQILHDLDAPGYGRIDLANHPSIRSWRAAGGRAIAAVAFLRVGPWLFLRTKRAPDCEVQIAGGHLRGVHGVQPRPR